MVQEARLVRTEHGLEPEGEGWYVLNAREARWYENPEYGGYVNFQGETWTYPLWQQLLHQVNHATQHRSEVAAQLTRFRHSPGWLDFLVYLDEQANPVAG